MSEERISIIVPTYRRRESVRRLLRALSGQTLAPGLFEVIVAIDGSDDGTRELVASSSAPFRIIGLWQPNAGRASACNLGARHAHGDILLFMDDDMEPDPGCVAGHLRTHVAGSNLAVLGAVPVRLDRPDPVVEYIQAKFSRFLEKIARPGYPIGIRDFYSGNTSVKRDIFQAVGGFDEEFRLYGLEDCELAVRLQAAGVQLVFAPEAIAWQHYLKSFAGLASDTLGKGANELLLARKHPEVLPMLRIGTRRQFSRKRRAFRASFTALTRVAPVIPPAVVHLIEALGKLRPASLDRCYELALDYFFWLGVQNAKRGRARSQTT